MATRIFLFSGEGTRGKHTGNTLFKLSPLWGNIDEVLRSELAISLDELWQNPDIHGCPHSPVLTVASQICLADLWKRWGYQPDMVLGHSIGELTAAYEAGFYSLKEIILLTHKIGNLTARLDGSMAHGILPREDAEKITTAGLAAFNFPVENGIHITLCGSAAEIDQFLADHPDFHRMKPCHPWHNQGYAQFVDDLEDATPRRGDGPLFVSGVTSDFTETLSGSHWQTWMTTTIDFAGATQAIASRVGDKPVEVIEIGFHPVLTASCEVFASCRYSSSMYRGEEQIRWMLFQRQTLGVQPLREALQQVVASFQAGLDFGQKLSYQGFTSLRFVALAARLEPYFPGLAPQDFYRYQTLDQLISQFGQVSSEEKGEVGGKRTRNGVVITGMSCKFPAASETPLQFWRSLLGKKDYVAGDPVRGDYQAGFLSEASSRFDHKYFKISDAEARTMDPQQILALELVELLLQDCGLDPEKLDRKRVGVYVGVWNEEYRGDRQSVYYPTGTNPSIIASRISYHYDLRGPSLVINTACSSSLVALHYACKDIEDGRIDFAIAGGVNMLLGNAFTHAMRDSGFLSPEFRCKTFDNSADGYVRAEGGGFVMLVNKALAGSYYAEVVGTAVNQNGGRTQVITAPHPEAQEELILEACRDAAIEPSSLDYVECHGTGTKLGDPIEVSALQNTVGRNRDNDCLLGAVKSNIGHLESAAGSAGLVKAILALQHGLIPGNLHFREANQFIDFASHHLKVVDQDTPLSKTALAGISSFGFGGANAHVIIKGAGEQQRKPLAEVTPPFNKDRATPLSRYFEHDDSGAQAAAADTSLSGEAVDIGALVASLFTDLTGVTELEEGVDITEQGLDSLSATEFVSTLQKKLGIDLDTDLLFDYPLPEQLIARLKELTAAGTTAEVAAS